MFIKRIDYPTKTKKYEITIKDKKYYCYINCWNGNYVVDDKGNNITNTKKGMEIILACNSK